MSSNALPVPQRASSGSAKPDISPIDYAKLLIKEGRRRIVTLAAIFAAISILALLVGLFVLARNYTASVTILAQDSDIIQPLLEGRAVSTGVADRAGMARQIIYGRKVLSEIVGVGGWDRDGSMSPVAKDRLMEDIRYRAVVTSPRPDLVTITYRDTDPERTYRVTDAFGAQFISEALAAKERESREAYEFIDKQVQDYHAKLLEAEERLRQYRSDNTDAQPGSATDANTRISSLRTTVEQTRMALLEQRSRENAIASQLSGESAVTAVQTRESLYRAQLLELQGQLDRLLLNYTEQHPDVVRVRHQMADLQQAMANEQTRRAAAPQGASPFDEAQMNPLYQELRSQQAQTRREVAATASRMAIAESMLNEELNRSRRIADSESALAELTRDYEVNRDIYQDLLRRRENARVSMQLDREERGLTLRVQDPATMPLRPTGLRFMHFAIGGLLMAVGIPLGLLFLRARFDPRIRSAQQLQRITERPLLTVVPTYHSPRDRRQELSRNAMSFGILALVVLAYGLAFGLKQLAA